LIRSIVNLSIKSSGGLSYEYLINAPLEELHIIIDEYNNIARSKNGN